MSAEHMRPEGLSQGYYCLTCGGGGVNMYATGHGTGKCTPNPELVAVLKELNSAPVKPGRSNPSMMPYMRCNRVRNKLLGKHEDHPVHIHHEGGIPMKCTGRFD